MKEVSQALLRQCTKGDNKSLTALYAIVFPTLMGMSRRYFTNRDEQVTIVNNCFMKLVKSLDRYEGTGPFEAWCRRLMTNTIIDEYRRNKQWKNTVILNGSTTDIAEGTHHTNDDHWTAEQLQMMLTHLPEATRCVFNLCAIDGYTHAEVATMLGISEGTSKWHLSKARELLRKILTKKHAHIPAA